MAKKKSKKSKGKKGYAVPTKGEEPKMPKKMRGY